MDGWYVWRGWKSMYGEDGIGRYIFATRDREAQSPRPQMTHASMWRDMDFPYHHTHTHTLTFLPFFLTSPQVHVEVLHTLNSQTLPPSPLSPDLALSRHSFCQKHAKKWDRETPTRFPHLPLCVKILSTYFCSPPQSTPFPILPPH